MCSTTKGFTLIEIMLVVIIIGLLAAVAVPRLVGKGKEARISIAKSDINSNIPTALDFYELDNGAYPTTEQGLQALTEKPNSTPTPVNWNGPYLKKLPKDPWGNAYNYKSPGDHNQSDFDLASAGPDGTEGSQDDVTNWEKD